jgi:hypothetical protein
MLKRISVVLGLTALLLGAAPKAEATPITGQILFGGTTQLTGGSTLDTATGLDFENSVVFSGTGSYSGITPFLTPATFTDFTFNPSSAVQPLWSVGFGGLTYSFDLASVVINVQNASTLGLGGTGTLYIRNGSTDVFDPTSGTWAFSTQSSGTNGQFSFSADSVASAIPEPATLSLLGIGLTGIGAAVRRRRKARQNA